MKVQKGSKIIINPKKVFKTKKGTFFEEAKTVDAEKCTKLNGINLKTL